MTTLKCEQANCIRQIAWVHFHYMVSMGTKKKIALRAASKVYKKLMDREGIPVRLLAPFTEGMLDGSVHDKCPCCNTFRHRD